MSQKPISEMTLKDATQRGNVILSVLWARALQLTTALVATVARLTKLSIMQSRIIVAAAAVVVVLAFVGFIFTSSAAANSPEGTARQYVAAEAIQDNPTLLDLTCSASQVEMQLAFSLGVAAATAQNLQRVDLNSVKYVTETRTPVRATVHISGKVRDGAAGAYAEDVPMLYERGKWRICRN